MHKKNEINVNAVLSEIRGDDISTQKNKFHVFYRQNRHCYFIEAEPNAIAVRFPSFLR